MILTKSKKKIMIYLTALLTTVSIILQIASIQFPNVIKMGDIVSLLLTQLIAPITFFVIVALLWKEPKPKIKKYKVVLLIIGAMILNIMVSIAVLSIASKVSAPTVENPIVGIEASRLPLALVLLAWAMFGEEAIKLSLFFAIFKGIRYTNEKRGKYWLSWVVVVVLFGLLHLSTYDYNFFQSIFVIGLPAIIYGYIWKKTEQPFVMWGTHYLYDAIIISLSLLT